MRIDPHHPAVQLHLVRPPAPVEPPPRSGPPSAPAVDTFDFEAAYVSRLPRLRLGEAHRRLERLRHELVAGRTHVPIHFEPPTPAPSRQPAIAGFLQLAPDPAEANAAATERLADASGQ